MLSQIRDFFKARNVLEVETPLLSQHTVTDRYISSFKTHYQNNTDNRTYYLQTSPEYAMKRLLAAGSGSIFQICKAFRNGECGHQHNPEFTLLEWYRPAFNHHDLMNEMDALLQTLLRTPSAERITYAHLFIRTLNINPHTCTLNELHAAIDQQALSIASPVDDKDTLLQLLLTHCIEPQLGQQAPTFVYDFPVSQAALAKIRRDKIPVAERFEVYIQGVELANGFHELTDAKEQRARFQKEQHDRQQRGEPPIEMDERLITALQHGLPDCAGVALGIDRLLMILSKSEKIDDIISFTWSRA